MAQEFTRNFKKLTTAQVHGKEIKEFTDVNDLVSNGTDNFIKKPDETMHCLTDNIKLIYKTENTELLDIELDNTKNSAKLTVKHNDQKEQRLYSSNKSIYLIPAVNGSGEKTDIQVTPQERQVYVDGNNNKVYMIYDEVNRIINVFALNPFTVSASQTDKTITLYYHNNGSTLPQLEDQREFGQYISVDEGHLNLKYIDGKTHYDEWSDVNDLLVHVRFDIIVE